MWQHGLIAEGPLLIWCSSSFDYRGHDVWIPALIEVLLDVTPDLNGQPTVRVEIIHITLNMVRSLESFLFRVTSRVSRELPPVPSAFKGTGSS